MLRANFRTSYSSYNHPLFAHYKVNSGLRRAASNNFATTTNDSTDPQVRSDSDSRQTPIVQSPEINLDQKLSPLANGLQVESKPPPTITTTNKPPPHYHKNKKCKSSKFVSKLRQNHSASSNNNNKSSNKTQRVTTDQNKSKSLIAKQFRANKTESRTGSINRSSTTVIQTSPTPFGLQLDQCLQDIKSSTII